MIDRKFQSKSILGINYRLRGENAFLGWIISGSVADGAIREELHRVNAEKCFPPLPDADVDTIAGSATGRYRKGKAGYPAFPDVKLLKDGSTRVLVTAGNTAAMLDCEGYEVQYDVILREIVFKRKGEAVAGVVPQIHYESLLTHLTDQYTRRGGEDKQQPHP